MRLYVETNFVLELVFEQEQAPACEAVLALVEEGSFELVLPALALVEARSTAKRRAAPTPFEKVEHKDFLREAGRMGPFKEDAEHVGRDLKASRDALAALQTRILGHVQSVMDPLLERLETCARTLRSKRRTPSQRVGWKWTSACPTRTPFTRR